uniref:Uncharacterized protein n=1 Tax=Oryzias latipes TaxID=8090 RepID=H2LET5_ORYLA
YCRWCPVCYWLLVLLGPKQRLLPQWLTGIIAVSGFLLLTFIAFVVKKVWCEKSSRSVRVHLYPGSRSCAPDQNEAVLEHQTSRTAL